MAEYVTDCVTVGTIERIIVENHGWCYASCMKCNKSVVLENEGSILRLCICHGNVIDFKETLQQECYTQIQFVHKSI